tara:strand:+ start:199 stop:1032 length:834 start_codon:yes stop_codon:yes gene_type:complete
MDAPALIKAIPSQGVNERAAFGPLDLTEFIQTPDGSDINFSAETAEGESLPKGMICTADGIVTGIPAKGTKGNYEIVVEAANEAGSIQAKFAFNIQPGIVRKDSQEYADELKQQVWQALEQNMPMPELQDILSNAVTPLDVYYLLERWATLTIYDAYNLDPPGEKHLIVLEGASEHYLTYDRGSCLVACPKDLFSHERTLADAIQTSQALAREAYQRQWVVELVGFEKLSRAAWVEFQHLGEKHNQKVEVLNYEPTTSDMKLYWERAQAQVAPKNVE